MGETRQKQTGLGAKKREIGDGETSSQPHPYHLQYLQRSQIILGPRVLQVSHIWIDYLREIEARFDAKINRFGAIQVESQIEKMEVF